MEMVELTTNVFIKLARSNIFIQYPWLYLIYLNIYTESLDILGLSVMSNLQSRKICLFQFLDTYHIG